MVPFRTRLLIVLGLTARTKHEDSLQYLGSAPPPSVASRAQRGDVDGSEDGLEGTACVDGVDGAVRVR